MYLLLVMVAVAMVGAPPSILSPSCLADSPQAALCLDPSTPCCATPCHTKPCYTRPYHAIPQHMILDHTIPYNTISYETIPCHTTLHHSRPYHAIPTMYQVTTCLAIMICMPHNSLPNHTITHQRIEQKVPRLKPHLCFLLNLSPCILATAKTFYLKRSSC